MYRDLRQNKYKSKNHFLTWSLSLRASITLDTTEELNHVLKKLLDNQSKFNDKISSWLD